MKKASAKIRNKVKVKFCRELNRMSQKISESPRRNDDKRKDESKERK